MTPTPRRRSRRFATVFVAVFAACGLTLTACGSDYHDDGSASATSEHHAATDTSATTALTAAMRSLWDQHMEWTWSTVVAFATDSPAFDSNVARLLRNQDDLGNAVGTFYGDEAGKQLTTLLKTHITDAVPVLKAAKAGDTTALDSAVDDWYANAQEIGDFLSTANPDWKQDDMRDMMKTHITQTIAYASDAIGGNWDDAIKSYDEAEAHMTDMADMLTQGIVKQFPDKF